MNLPLNVKTTTVITHIIKTTEDNRQSLQTATLVEKGIDCSSQNKKITQPTNKAILFENFYDLYFKNQTTGYLSDNFGVESLSNTISHS